MPASSRSRRPASAAPGSPARPGLGIKTKKRKGIVNDGRRLRSRHRRAVRRLGERRLFACSEAAAFAWWRPAGAVLTGARDAPMPALKTALDPRSETFRANATALRAQVADLEARILRIRGGGGEP